MLVKWRGGKARMVKLLLPLIPAHVCYVEPFCGGAALFAAKAKSKVEVLNDVNGDLINLFRCAKYHQAELCSEVALILNGRQNLREFLAQPGLTDIQRAGRWLARNWMSFSADCKTFGVQRKSGGGAATSRAGVMERILATSLRLDSTIIEELDFARCIRLYDSRETFFFCDPPYLGKSIDTYGPWTEEKFAELKKVLFGIKGQWLLTVDDSKFQRALWAGCRQRRVKTRGQACKASAQTFGELIVQPEGRR